MLYNEGMGNLREIMALETQPTNLLWKQNKPRSVCDDSTKQALKIWSENKVSLPEMEVWDP